MMLIDMGGGTVDMTIHDIDSLAGGDAMSMSEATHRECLAEVGLLPDVLPQLSMTL
jgi:cell division ATPase FtsA